MRKEGEGNLIIYIYEFTVFSIWKRREGEFSVQYGSLFFYIYVFFFLSIFCFFSYLSALCWMRALAEMQIDEI